MLENQQHIICARCNKAKDRDEFYNRKNGKPLSYCIKCQRDVKELKLEENIERILEERGGCCADCQGIFPAVIYDFYKDGKIYQISKAKNMSLKRIKEEISDFIMLCKNCSGIRQWEYYSESKVINK